MHAEIRRALQHRRFFKLICGASYRNAGFVATLARIFTLAGAHVIDVGADPALVAAAHQGIAAAGASHGLPLIMVSIGINQDVHFMRVAKEQARCDHHGFCANACPHEVFVGDEMRLENCLGCDYCVKACPTGALTLVPREPFDALPAILSSCLEAGATALEIHTGSGERAQLRALWEQLRPWRADFQLLAFSLGAHGQEPRQVAALAKDVVTLAGSDIIIQADGQPISGRKGQKSTMPCLALAKYLLEQQLPAFIQVSGGTNNLTGSLANREQIPIHGIAMGSFARKYLDLSPSGILTPDDLDRSVARARELVLSVTS